jgi:hypothetical protein
VCRVGFEQGTSRIKSTALALHQSALPPPYQPLRLHSSLQSCQVSISSISGQVTIPSHPCHYLTRAHLKFRRNISERIASYAQSSGRRLYYINQLRLLSQIIRCYSRAITSNRHRTENCKHSIRTHKAQFNYGIEKGKLRN